MRTRSRNTIATRLGLALLLSALALVGTTSADESRKKAKPYAGESRKLPTKEEGRQKNVRAGLAAKQKRAKGKQHQRKQHLAAAIKHLKAAGLDEVAEEVSQLRNKRKRQGDSRLSEQLEGIEDRIEQRFEELERQIARKLEKLEAENSEGGEDSDEGAEAEPPKKPG